MRRARGVELDVGWGWDAHAGRAWTSANHIARSPAHQRKRQRVPSMRPSIETLSHRCAKGGHRKTGGGSKTPPTDSCPDLAWKKSGESCGGPCSAAAVRRRPAMPDRNHNPHYTQDMVWQEYDVKRPPKLGGVFEN